MSLSIKPSTDYEVARTWAYFNRSNAGYSFRDVGPYYVVSWLGRPIGHEHKSVKKALETGLSQ